MKKLPLGLLSLILLASSSLAQAKTAEELLATGTAQEKGEAIAIEFDDRDIGWGDVEVDMSMVLKNANGKSITRVQHNRILQNPGREEGDKSLITFDSPRDVKGTAFLSFAKILEPDDQWLYLPALGKVKRISSSNKSGPFLGSEFAYEDITGNEVGKYSWEFVALEPCGDNAAGQECFKLESYPKYEHSGYTKRTVWTDTEHFRLQKVEYYDRKGDLLKTQTVHDYSQYLDKFWRAARWEMVNHQSGKSTTLNFEKYNFNTGLSDADFSKAKLKRAK